MTFSLLRLQHLLLLFTATIVSGIGSNAVAQDEVDHNDPFPTDPSAWLNGPPITMAMLEGKAAVLYFFEEG